MDLYTDYLLISLGQTTATGLAALIPDLSHNQITRFLSSSGFLLTRISDYDIPFAMLAQSETLARYQV